MRIRLFSSITITVCVLALMALASTPAAAQVNMPGYKPPTGPAPKMPDGKQDYSGVYQPPRMADVTQTTRCCIGNPTLPFTEFGKTRWEAYDASKGDYAGSCLPFGLLRSVGGPHPVQVMQNAKYLAELWEQNSWFHVTPLGIPHSQDPSPTWFGESRGNWVGDKLVIDTIAFNGKTRIDTIGHPHSEQLHTIEKFDRSSLGVIDYVITINDPKTFTKPWDSVRKWFLHPEWEIMEYACEENNKDLQEGHIAPGLNP